VTRVNISQRGDVQETSNESKFMLRVVYGHVVYCQCVGINVWL